MGVEQTKRKITAEQATGKLLLRDWIWEGGYWKPSMAAIDEKPEITPGNYTAEQALSFYGIEVGTTND